MLLEVGQPHPFQFKTELQASPDFSSMLCADLLAVSLVLLFVLLLQAQPRSVSFPEAGSLDR